MSEEYFSVRKQLEEMQKDINKVYQELTKLAVVADISLQERSSNATRLGKLEEGVTSFKGGMALLKGIIGLFGASAVAFCTWIVSSSYETTKAIQETNQRHAVLTEKVAGLHNDTHENNLALEKLNGR